VVAAGQTTGTVTLTAVQETLVVGNETIVVDITGVTQAFSTSWNITPSPVRQL